MCHSCPDGLWFCYTLSHAISLCSTPEPPSDQIQYHQSRMTRQLWLLCISEKMILCEQSVVCSVFTPPFNFAPLWTSFGVAPQKVPGTIHNFCHWRPTKYESNESYHTVEIYDIKFSFSYNYSQQVTIGLSCPQWRFGIEFRKKTHGIKPATFCKLDDLLYLLSYTHPTWKHVLS